jgi:hypothetical protein
VGTPGFLQKNASGEGKAYRPPESPFRRHGRKKDMKRSGRLLLIIGSAILVLSGAGMAISPPAQAAAESICAAPGNSYCWSQPDTGNAIVLTDTNNIASFTPENCQPYGSPISTETCQLVAVDGDCVRAQYEDGAPILLDGCGGKTELSEYWYRGLCSGSDYLWINLGATIYFKASLGEYAQVAEVGGAGQGNEVFLADSESQGCTDGPSQDVDEWIWG